jgi:hypothetical protein
MGKIRIKYLALLTVFLSPISANADLIGDTVTMDWLANGDPCPLCSSVDVVVEVGNGDIASPNPTVLDVNVESSSILIDILTTGIGSFTYPDNFNGLIVSSLDWVDDPSGFISDVLFSTDILDFDPNRITFDGHSVSVNFASLSIVTGQFITLDLVTSHSVPEPGTLALLGLGLAGMGIARRRRKV